MKRSSTTSTPTIHRKGGQALGSSNYLSDVLGEVYQHVEYLPWGETFLEERNTQTDRNTYLYTGKELDLMTGLYYYEQRYFDPNKSTFLGVDVLTEKSPSISGFAYVANNPLIFIDPDGRKVLMYYAKSTAGVGSGVGVSISLYRGTAYDNYGITHFTFSSFGLPSDIENNTEPPIVLGAGGYLGGVGGSIDWKAKSYRVAIEKWGFSISGGSVVIVGMGYTAKSEDSIDGINAELGFGGFGLSVSGTGGGEINFKESISVSYGESMLIGNRFGSSRQWFVADEKPILDNNGNIIGYSGSVFSHIFGLSHTFKNSGVKVQCGVIKDSEGNISPDKIWTSKFYRTEQLID